MSERGPDASRVMSVRTELVRELLVGGMLEAGQARLQDELPSWAEAASARALQQIEPNPPTNPQLTELAAQLARAGYCARLVEVEMFEPARRTTPGLADQLKERSARSGDDLPAVAADLSAELALQEPTGRPDLDDDPPVSWRVPGPGGHVRHYLALAYIQSLGGSPSQAELKRSWMYGFFLRCCEESLRGW